MTLGVNYVIYGCSSARITPGVSLYQSCLTLEENTVAVITQDKVIDDNLKRQIKSQTLCTCRLFLLTYIFQYISYSSKVFYLLPNCQFLMGNNFSVD